MIGLGSKKNWQVSVYFVVIYAFLGVNFILQKFCSCKKNDKYHVCIDNKKTSPSNVLEKMIPCTSSKKKEEAENKERLRLLLQHL